MACGHTCTCTPPSNTPTGGMGQSARCSKIFWLAPTCPIVLDGTPPATGTLAYFSEQVTRIEIRSQVASRKYGHDKSYCAQDTTKGIASWNGSIQTKAQCVSPPFSFFAGATIWLCIYPLGTTNGSNVTPCISGYAEIEEDPIIMNLENGDPVEHNYTYSSKGWWNLPTGMTGTFDCCKCCCTSGMDAEEESELINGTSLLDSDPVTVYKWTDAGNWAIAFDELPPGFVHGPTPNARTEQGKKAGELRFVKCIKVAQTADLHSHSGIVTVGA